MRLHCLGRSQVVLTNDDSEKKASLAPAVHKRLDALFAPCGIGLTFVKKHLEKLQ